MKRIEEVRIVTSVADQVLDLPVESVVLLRAKTPTFGRAFYANTVLHRTGPEGWLLTRNLGYMNYFHHNEGVRVIIDRAVADEAQVFLLYNPEDVDAEATGA